MKNIFKKIINLSLCFVVLFVLASCKFFESGSTLKFQTLPESVYIQGSDNASVEEVMKTVTVVFDGEVYTLTKIQELGATVKGLNFETLGSKILVVTFDHHTISFEYEVKEPHVHNYVYFSLENGTHYGKCSCGKDDLPVETCDTKGDYGACSKCGHELETPKKVVEVTYTNSSTVKKYDSVDALIADTTWKNDGAVITIYKDDTFTKQLVLDKNITLDFNGHTLTGIAEITGNQYVKTYNDVIQAAINGKTIIIKNGTLIAEEVYAAYSDKKTLVQNAQTNYRAAITGKDTCTLKIQDMTVISNSAVLRKNGICNCYIENCKFITEDEHFNICWHCSTAGHSELNIKNSSIQGNIFAYSNGANNVSVQVSNLVKINNSTITGTITSRMYVEASNCGAIFENIPTGYKVQSKANPATDAIETLFQIVTSSTAESDGWTDYNYQN